ncbi:hypothetical protein BKA70DRAFT_1217484 [Coprinopsis sp. MPI-PUGE-AT-0042]|nr:hypothetical protein BKA70DRAFT_1217484 [Coprinopsis sp. MPI-PUGE-AT-0042]
MDRVVLGWSDSSYSHPNVMSTREDLPVRSSESKPSDKISTTRLFVHQESQTTLDIGSRGYGTWTKRAQWSVEDEVLATSHQTCPHFGYTEGSTWCDCAHCFCRRATNLWLSSTLIDHKVAEAGSSSAAQRLPFANEATLVQLWIHSGLQYCRRARRFSVLDGFSAATGTTSATLKVPKMDLRCEGSASAGVNRLQTQGLRPASLSTLKPPRDKTRRLERRSSASKWCKSLEDSRIFIGDDLSPIQTDLFTHLLPPTQLQVALLQQRTGSLHVGPWDLRLLILFPSKQVDNPHRLISSWELFKDSLQKPIGCGPNSSAFQGLPCKIWEAIAIGRCSALNAPIDRWNVGI